MATDHPPAVKRCGVAVVGCGTVGGGTASLLRDEADRLERQTGTTFELVAVVDQNLTHARSLGLPESLLRTDVAGFLNDPRVDVVVELVGGTGFAKTLIEGALDAGKHLVTANKALLATHGPALFARARARGRTIGFEASCAGAIPVVRTLAEDLVANRVLGLAGIVNGTCNAILTDMGGAGLDYETALKRAQDAGYAEAAPFLDVSGTDSAHKLALLTAVGLGVWVDWSTIPLRGLETVHPSDLTAAGFLGARVKLLARAEAQPDGVTLSVEPTAIPLPHPLATLEGPFNGVLIDTSDAGRLYLQGRGAGARPTASAVVADLAALAVGTAGATQRDYTCWPDRVPAGHLLASGSRGPWLVHRAGEEPRLESTGARADWEGRGFRVLPWYDPR